MGSIMRKRVTNVLEVPQDILAKMIGRGLHVNREEFPVQLEVNTGDGLAFDESGALVVDMEVDESKCSEFILQTDSNLLLDGRKLTLRKIYTRFKIHRNYDNYILDIVPYEQFESSDDVIMTDYGYVAIQNKSAREATPGLPNFYKK
jgi:hypothetical protein